MFPQFAVFLGLLFHTHSFSHYLLVCDTSSCDFNFLSLRPILTHFFFILLMYVFILQYLGREIAWEITIYKIIFSGMSTLYSFFTLVNSYPNVESYSKVILEEKPLSHGVLVFRVPSRSQQPSS